jgi:hypothetical protein
MVDFAAAGKKSPVHISICTGLSIVGTTATLWRIHLTTHLTTNLEILFLRPVLFIEAILIETIIPLSKKLSIV